jgi:hypothetical protein
VSLYVSSFDELGRTSPGTTLQEMDENSEYAPYAFDLRLNG